MKTMILAAAAALTLGSATAFAAGTGSNNSQKDPHQAQQMYQQYSQPANNGFDSSAGTHMTWQPRSYQGAIGGGGNG